MKSGTAVERPAGPVLTAPRPPSAPRLPLSAPLTTSRPRAIPNRGPHCHHHHRPSPFFVPTLGGASVVAGSPWWPAGPVAGRVWGPLAADQGSHRRQGPWDGRQGPAPPEKTPHHPYHPTPPHPCTLPEHGFTRGPAGREEGVSPSISLGGVCPRLRVSGPPAYRGTRPTNAGPPPPPRG